MEKPVYPVTSAAGPTRASPFFRSTHLLVTAALGLTLCQLPLLVWLLPRSGLQQELSDRFPLVLIFLEPLQASVWLPIAMAAGLNGLCLGWVNRNIVRPLLQLRGQVDHLRNHHFTVEPVFGGRNAEIEAVTTAFETLRRELAQQALEHQKLAYEDSMTGLQNRLRFVMTVDAALQSSLKRILVVVWQLDRFASLNAILGFAAGDHLLKALGMRLRQQLGDTLAIARLAGHTFACAFELDEEDCPQSRIVQVLDTLTEPLKVYGQPIELTAACGAAISPRDGQAAADLTRRAEIAQNIASASRLRWMLFQNHFEVQSSARLNMLSELRAALQAQGQLQLFLQPKLHLGSGRIEEAEALLRWQHPQRGMVFPNEFIPFAEQTGRIHELTLWAIAEALRILPSVSHLGPMVLSVNISAMDLHEPDFATAVERLLSHHAVKPDCLCLEITESWAMDRPEQVLETLDRLHRHGIRLAIDDFGSGYSSMSYMKRFPVDELKIDRSLVAGIRRNSDSETILRCIAELGHSMGMTVTAEGVETLEEYSVVRALGVDSIQGYLIGKAMPINQFLRFVEDFDSQHLPSLPLDSDLGLGPSNRPVHPAKVGRQQNNASKRNAVPRKNSKIVRADVTQQPADTDESADKA